MKYSNCKWVIGLDLSILLCFLQELLKAPLQQNQYLQLGDQYLHLEDHISRNKSQSVLHFLPLSL